LITVMHTIYVIISHNISVLMIGHLELATGMLTFTLRKDVPEGCTMPHWHGLKNLSVNSDFSQMHLSRSGFDCSGFDCEWI